MSKIQPPEAGNRFTCRFFLFLKRSNELKAKQLRAWADIRNAAAHGEFDKFKRADVEGMIRGVSDFLATYYD